MAVEKNAPPSGWSMHTGTWGLDAQMSDAAGAVLVGDKSVALSTSTATKLASPLQPIEGGRAYLLEGLVRADTVLSSPYLRVEYYLADKSTLDPSNPHDTINSAQALANQWETRSIITEPSSSARWFRLIYGKDSGSYNVWWNGAMLKPMPLSCQMYLNSSYTNFTAGDQKIDLDQFTWDYGSMADASNNRINIKRAGLYQITGAVYYDPGINPAIYHVEIWRNGGSLAEGGQGFGSTANTEMRQVSIQYPCNAGDYLELYMYADNRNASSLYVSGRYRTFLLATECRA